MRKAAKLLTEAEKFLTEEQMKKLTTVRLKNYWKSILRCPETKRDDIFEHHKFDTPCMTKDNPLWIEHHELVTKTLAEKMKAEAND